MPTTMLTTYTQVKNLNLLFMLRNIAIAGQLVAIFFATGVLGISLPLIPMLLVIGFLAIINVFNGYRINVKAQLNIANHEMFVQLLIDTGALALLIYFSGGAANPFTGFFLLPVIIAAILLGPLQTWLMVIITSCAYFALSQMRYEMPGMPGTMEHSEQFHLHLHGMLISYLICACLVAFFVVKMARNLRERDEELHKIQQQAYAESEIMKLGMLAAGAAHELATPLNAIQLVSDELRESLKDQPTLLPQLHLLQRQVDRCCKSMNDLMTVVRQPRALNTSQQALNTFLTELADNWQHLHPGIRLERQLSKTEGVVLVVDQLLAQAIVNLLDNAAQASCHKVILLTNRDDEKVELIIEDEGTGMPDDIRKMIENNRPVTDEDGNVRLGLLLVKTLIQRMGGALLFRLSDTGVSQAVLSIPLTPSGNNRLSSSHALSFGNRMGL